MPGAELVRDEGIRDGSTVEKLAGLRALFAEDGTVTAGNSSSINDGASAVLLGAEGALDAEPLALITGRGAHGVDPDQFPTAPIEAANKALGPRWPHLADVDLVELNEAFASQSLACLRGWPDFDPEKLNIHGGALADRASARRIRRTHHRPRRP